MRRHAREAACVFPSCKLLLADKLDELAGEAANNRASYTQFEDILTKLHAAGFFPEMSLISVVAQAM
jgi:hypothetical protein